MLVCVKYECFVMQMLYVCVLCASCGSSQCCIPHDLQFVDAGRGCKRQPYERAPNDTAYKRLICQSGHKLMCKLCRTFPPDLPFFCGKPAIRTRWMAGAAPHNKHHIFLEVDA